MPNVIVVNQGTQIRVDAVFTLAGASTPTDPTTIKLKTRAPGASTTTDYTYGQPGSIINRTGAGLYYAHLTLTTAGPWWVSWHGEGGNGPIVVGEVMVKVADAVNV
jgi:hypothetical protein